MTSALRQV